MPAGPSSAALVGADVRPEPTKTGTTGPVAAGFCASPLSRRTLVGFNVELPGLSVQVKPARQIESGRGRLPMSNVQRTPGGTAARSATSSARRSCRRDGAAREWHRALANKSGTEADEDEHQERHLDEREGVVGEHAHGECRDTRSNRDEQPASVGVVLLRLLPEPSHDARKEPEPAEEADRLPVRAAFPATRCRGCSRGSSPGGPRLWCRSPHPGAASASTSAARARGRRFGHCRIRRAWMPVRRRVRPGAGTTA